MADLRYINTSDPTEPGNASQNGMFLYGDNSDHPIVATNEILAGDDSNTPLVGSGRLSDHHVGQIEESNTKGKLLAGLIVALMVGAAGVYAYTTSDSAPAKMANKEAAAQRAEISTTPQQQTVADDTIFTPSEEMGAPMAAPTPAAPEVQSEPTAAQRAKMKASENAQSRPVRMARAARPATAANESEARANAATQATNQSMAENATRRSLPLNSAPDSMATVQPTAPTTPPILPSAEPNTPAPAIPAPTEPAPATPVQ